MSTAWVKTVLESDLCFVPTQLEDVDGWRRVSIGLVRWECSASTRYWLVNDWSAARSVGWLVGWSIGRRPANVFAPQTTHVSRWYFLLSA